LILELLGYLCENGVDKFVGDFGRMLQTSVKVLGYPCQVNKL